MEIGYIIKHLKRDMAYMLMKQGAQETTPPSVWIVRGVAERVPKEQHDKGELDIIKYKVRRTAPYN